MYNTGWEYTALYTNNSKDYHDLTTGGRLSKDGSVDTIFKLFYAESVDQRPNVVTGKKA